MLRLKVPRSLQCRSNRTGRLLVGVGIGMSAVVVPAYVAETAPAKHRGALVSLYEALLCVGMLCASLVNFALHDVPGASFACVCELKDVFAAGLPSHAV